MQPHTTAFTMPSFLTPLRRAAAAALLALTACATQPDVHADRDASVDLRAYRTFAWFDTGSAPAYAGLWSRHLQQATRQQLERQGYVYSEVQPDLRVNLIVAVKDKVELRSAPTGGRLYGWRHAGVESVPFREGTLAIDLVDARRNALVWRGVAEGRLTDAQVREPAQLAASAVSEIFAAFPVVVR
ncbi:MAG: DUF4136 domain-containing protein [Piscinibacter sp.]|nr:DUF4136 domain-containing protein [Piscinibacter sp.]